MHIYAKYDVEYTNEYNYIEDRIGDEYFYASDQSKWSKVMDGGDLIDLVGNILTDSDILNFKFTQNPDDISSQIFYASTFNPYNGTGENICIKYKEVKVARNENEAQNRIY